MCRSEFRFMAPRVQGGAGSARLSVAAYCPSIAVVIPSCSAPEENRQTHRSLSLHTNHEVGLKWPFRGGFTAERFNPQGSPSLRCLEPVERLKGLALSSGRRDTKGGKAMPMPPCDTV